MMHIARHSKLLYFSLLAFLLAVPGVVFAQEASTGETPERTPDDSGGGFEFTNPLRFDTIGDFFKAVLELMVLIGFPIVVLAIMYGGFLLVTARGNEEQLTKGKRALLWAVIGGVIVLGAQVLVQAIGGTVDTLRSETTLLLIQTLT